MAEGDVSTDGYSSVKQGYFFPQRSIGSRTIVRELMTLHNLWVPLTQMLQVAPGHLWCQTCGNVRPNTYFDIVAWDERGKVTAWKKGKPTAWDGIRFPVQWHDECKECVNARDPKLSKVKYCSACRIDHPRGDFGDDERNVDGKKSLCKKALAKDEHERRLRKAAELGRELRGYQWAR